MLTVEMLKEMPPHTIFAHGVVTDNEFGINMTGSGRDLRWVACRGGMHDWAIYCGWLNQSDEDVQHTGDKVCFPKHIRRLVECDDESFDMYRF